MSNSKDGYIVAFRVDEPHTNGKLEAYLWNGRDFYDAIANIQARAAACVSDIRYSGGADWSYVETIRVDQIAEATVAGPMGAMFAEALSLAPKWCLHSDENGMNRQPDTHNQFFCDAFWGTVYLTGARRGSGVYQPLSRSDVMRIKRATNDDLKISHIAEIAGRAEPTPGTKVPLTRAQRKSHRRAA